MIFRLPSAPDSDGIRDSSIYQVCLSPYWESTRTRARRKAKDGQLKMGIDLSHYIHRFQKKWSRMHTARWSATHICHAILSSARVFFERHRLLIDRWWWWCATLPGAFSFFFFFWKMLGSLETEKVWNARGSVWKLTKNLIYYWSGRLFRCAFYHYIYRQNRASSIPGATSQLITMATMVPACPPLLIPLQAKGFV